ncbi:MAG: hypothetical protein JW795_09925, partial [Chitinivibrionales bacterium]|nr:hypothetical protein [Chitinivibrionales bacterium]
MLKSLEPLKRVFLIAAQIDSLSKEQQACVDSTRFHLNRCIRAVGDLKSAGFIQLLSAPIPEQILTNSVARYQYKKQLIETIEPMVNEKKDFFLKAIDDYAANLSSDSSQSATWLCDSISQTSPYIASLYDSLGLEILEVTHNKVAPETSDGDQEDLMFQLEDIAYEVQDEALSRYEEAWQELQTSCQTLSAQKQNQIRASLARLKPQQYGQDFYRPFIFTTDSSWMVTTDSLRYWNTQRIADGGWKRPLLGDRLMLSPQTNVATIWSDDSLAGRIFMRRSIFIDGLPRMARAWSTASGPYRIFVNEKLLFSDTFQTRTPLQIDSMSNITMLLKGGENIIACEVSSQAMKKGVALAFSVLADTTVHFTQAPEVLYAQTPDNTKVPQATNSITASGAALNAVASSRAPLTPNTDSTLRQPSREPKVVTANLSAELVFRPAATLVDSIVEYRRIQKQAQQAIIRESIEVEKLRIQMSRLDMQLNLIVSQIDSLKKTKSAVVY